MDNSGSGTQHTNLIPQEGTTVSQQLFSGARDVVIHNSTVIIVGGNITHNASGMIMSMPGFTRSAFGNGAEGANVDLSQESLQVYTVGHLLPKDPYVQDAQGNGSFDSSSLSPTALLGELGMGAAGASGLGSNDGPPGRSPIQDFGDNSEEVAWPPNDTLLAPSPFEPSPFSLGSTISDAPPGGAPKVRVGRSTFVPRWAVPPRVLLVDDDIDIRKLSSKFLKAFGCTIDVAVDGISAVNKMNLIKYDLALMDTVMPKLDGVSATNLIRKFDQGTPIISMTSKLKPHEITKYYSSGMNDILPKPFTKERLQEILEKHLMPLKVIAKNPRTVDVLPLSDANFEQQALAMSAKDFTPFQQGSSLLSPRPVSDALSSFLDRHLADEQYNMILRIQNIMNEEGLMGMTDGMSSPGSSSSSSTRGKSEKRPLEGGEDDRRRKRSRF